MKSPMLLALCFASASLFLAANAFAAEPPEVLVGKPVVREIRDHENFAGRAAAVRQVTIRSRVTGYLVKIAFKEGSMVKEGDLLYELDGQLQKAELDKTKAELTVAEARFDRAKKASDRAKRLRETGAVGADEIDRAEGDYKEAKALTDVAKTAIVLADLQLSYTRVTAPISGRIGRSNYDEGNLVTANVTELVKVSSTDPICAAFDIDETTLLRLAQSLRDGKLKADKTVFPVRIGFYGKEGYPQEGKLDLENFQVDPATGTAHCRAIMPNPKHEIWPGKSVRVRLTSEPYKALLLPASAAIESLGPEGFIYVVNDKNAIERRFVTFGNRDTDGMIVVKEGLLEGERVVLMKRADVSFRKSTFEVGMKVTPKEEVPVGKKAEQKKD